MFNHLRGIKAYQARIKALEIEIITIKHVHERDCEALYDRIKFMEKEYFSQQHRLDVMEVSGHNLSPVEPMSAREKSVKLEVTPYVDSGRRTGNNKPIWVHPNEINNYKKD